MCSALKRHFSSNHFKKYDAQGPKICFLIEVSSMSNFRRHVVGSSDIALHHLIFVRIKKPCNSEVSQLYFLVFSHKNVGRLQISVHYPTQVHHLHCVSNLLEYFLSFIFGKWSVYF